MRVVVFLCLLGLAAAHPPLVEPSGAFDYHTKLGIPLAKSIKEAEDSYFAENASVTNDGRIVGGAIAPTGAHPYLAGLLVEFWNIAGAGACGSCLLSANRLATAAHCWFDGRNIGRQYTVVLGSNFLYYGGVRVVTSNVIMHPLWMPSVSLHNDIAMIYLPYSIGFTAAIQPIAIPFDNDDFVGQWAVAAGWGVTSNSLTSITIDQVISHVNLQVISVQQCQMTFGHHIAQSTICTNGLGGVGICRGDSGGPLIVNRFGQNLLVGISSFVADNDCEGGHPSAYARVTSFRSFIQQHM